MNWKLTSLGILLAAQLQAQESIVLTREVPAEYHAVRPELKTTILNAEENNYDINYLRFDISMGNTSTDVAGSVTTKARVVVSQMQTYMFELDASFTVDSVKVNGVPLPCNTNGDLRMVPLNPILTQNMNFTAQVYYHGHPPAGTTFFTRGLVTATVGSDQLLYSLSDRYLAKDWWPCKQSLGDKIDSVDMWVTIPAGLKVGSNGVLKNVTAMGGGANRYEWKSNYPIDYYLISVAIGPYKDYSFYAHYNTSTDSTLVQNYILDSANFMTQHKPILDTIGLTMDWFSQLFGRYPFWKEKYGHTITNLLGGMEHQTMTNIGYFQMTTFAHELGHEWWGDHVTYKTWQDIWLSEGFATYCEQLFVEHFRTPAQAQSMRDAVFNNVMTNSGGTLFVDDTVSDSRVFDGRLTYNKGAAVSHMLRFVAPDDAAYFNGLKSYQQQYAYGLANTEDMKAKLQAAYGYNLDTFFTQWIYGEGYPTYNAKWAQSGQNVIIQLRQNASKPAVTKFFYTPLEIRLQSATGDSIIRIYNKDSLQMIAVNWGRTMTGMTIDPSNHILNKVSGITNDPTLSVHGVSMIVPEVYPNPAQDAWTAEHIPSGALLSLTDLTGRIVWQHRGDGSETITIPCTHLSSGLYDLRIEQKGLPTQNLRLLRL